MLNIGLDLDGVICKWVDILPYNRTQENYDKLPIIEEVCKNICAIWNMGNNLTIITARHYLNARNHVYDWLDRVLPNTISYDVIVGIPTSYKWRVLQSINADIHIDDNIRAFNRLPKNIIPILFCGTHNTHLSWEGLKVNNWSEVVTMIKFLKEKLNK